MDDVEKERLLSEYNFLREKVAKKSASAFFSARLGSVCLALGYRDEALHNFKEALEKNPKYGDVVEIVKTHYSQEELNKANFLVEAQPFWKNIASVFIYPLASEGKFIILAGALLFTILSLVPLTGFLLCMIFVYPLITAYMIHIIRHVADGENEMPDWPDIYDFWDSLILPSLQMCSALLVSFAPLILIVIYSRDLKLIIIAFILGSIYFPVALMAAALFDNVFAPLNFPYLINSIRKMGKDYFIALFILPVITVIGKISLGVLYFQIPVIGQFVFWSFTIYFSVVEMYILGNVYYVNERKLGWF